MDKKIKELIETADWHDITRRLAGYALSRVRYVFGIKDKLTVLPMGASVESVVQESIKKLLDGTRQWNPDQVDLLGFLMGVVKSEISHLAALKDNQLTDKAHSTDNLDNRGDEELNPEERLIKKEEERLIAEVYQKLIGQAEKNSDYETIALCIMSGITKPADIAEQSGIEINKVYRLKRTWQKDFELILREVLSKAN